MNAEKRIVLVIDMQNDFITGTLGTAEARRIVPAARCSFSRGTRTETITCNPLKASSSPLRIANRAARGGRLRLKSPHLRRARASLTSPRSAASHCRSFCAHMWGRKRNSCLWAFARTSAWCRTHSFCGLISREIVSLSRRIAARASRLKAMRRRSLQ